MKTQAVCLYGKKDLRLETFELPPITDGEILAKVVSDSICMSSYKAAEQGADHKRVPDNVAENPVIIGHEFSGEIVEVGAKWKKQFQPGMKYTIQPALNYKGSLDAPGYSYRYIGGDATYVIIPEEVMEMGCLLPFTGDAFFLGSLAEPMSCVIGAVHANYHTRAGSYVHHMDIKEGGSLAVLAGVGPMGLGAINYLIHRDRRPARMVVTDIDDARLARAASLYSPQEAAAYGIELLYLNASDAPRAEAEMRAFTGGEGFDDLFVFAPVGPVVEMADRLLAKDGCLNFFAGPSNPNFSASLNFYRVHYDSTHITGTSGGNTDDMIEALKMMSEGTLNPAPMITHIGGLDAVIDTTLHLPSIPGGKKLIYTHTRMPLVALSDLSSKREESAFYRQLADIVEANNGLWSVEAERFLLANAPVI